MWALTHIAIKNLTSSSPDVQVDLIEFKVVIIILSFTTLNNLVAFPWTFAKAYIFFDML